MDVNDRKFGTDTTIGGWSSDLFVSIVLFYLFINRIYAFNYQCSGNLCKNPFRFTSKEWMCYLHALHTSVDFLPIYFFLEIVPDEYESKCQTYQVIASVIWAILLFFSVITYFSQILMVYEH